MILPVVKVPIPYNRIKKGNMLNEILVEIKDNTKNEIPKANQSARIALLLCVVTFSFFICCYMDNESAGLFLCG